MGSACSDTSGDASHHAHPLSGLPREANSPRGECGYVGRRAGVDEARARTATGLRHRIKLVRVEILPEIIGPRVGCALPRASCEHACAACVSDERRSNALEGSMSPSWNFVGDARGERGGGATSAISGRHCLTVLHPGNPNRADAQSS